MKKPLKWYIHKIPCEFGYWLYLRGLTSLGMKIYYKHLHLLCKTGFNLYGDKF